MQGFLEDSQKVMKMSYETEMENAIILWNWKKGDYADDLEPYDFDIDFEEDVI